MSAKRSLYKIADPFCRIWFRVVAPNRGFLAAASAQAREKLWKEAKPGLASAAWEDLCRKWVTSGASHHAALGGKGNFESAKRFWHGEGPEWDVVSQTLDERFVLVGEVKWSERQFDILKLRSLARALLKKGIPPVQGLRNKKLCPVVFVPEVAKGAPSEIDGVHVVTGDQIQKEIERR